ncbi:hypothetical protein [Geomicrobium sediminis]|uniref:Uncharacterized protein n=1 Tax=Geomicrobium sediminis TaxID=1347788 RepID=A0ABS2PCE7_9BACL|nr:hypothetical protein [Geomicrobium sediminis]MBM7632967.1 hypothetical protein [Geomicrobium sediminis]
MNIQLILFITSVHEDANQENSKMMMKAFESDFRPALGDIIEDPGFDPRFHNGYEVAKVTVNYSANECLVSLSPIAIEKEEIAVTEYVDKLLQNGWKVCSLAH